jgi:dihydrofolate synthase/folylpolyglutamate synthase
MLNDKDARGVLTVLGNDTRAIVITRPEGIRGSEWHRLGTIWHDIYPDKVYYCQEKIKEAVESGCQLLNEGEYLLVTGSFYVISQARRELINT